MRIKPRGIPIGCSGSQNRSKGIEMNKKGLKVLAMMTAMLLCNLAVQIQMDSGVLGFKSMIPYLISAFLVMFALDD